MLSLSQSILTTLSRKIAVLEINAEYFGVLTLQLIENLGSVFVKEITKRFDSPERVTIFSGTDENGRDGDFTICKNGSHLSATSLKKWIPKVMKDPMLYLAVKRLT